MIIQSASDASEKGLIIGSAKHGRTGHPIMGVNITIVNTTLGTMTDTNGEFTLKVHDAGSCTIRATMMGFEAVEQTIRLEPDSTQHVSFLLKPTVLRINKEIVVTAKRDETNVFDIPNSMAVVSQDELNRKIPRSTPEALMETAGVWMQKTNHGGGSPFIRGLVGNQVLVLVDGIRLNNATYRYGPNQYLSTIDPWQIERIEVLRGSGSVLYGSDALGGVVNVITKGPRFSSDGFQVSGNVYSRYMSSDMEKSGRVEFGIGSQRIAVLGGVSVKDFGDIKAGGNLGMEKPSGYSEVNGDVKAICRFSARNLITVAYHNVRQNQVPSYDQIAQRGYQQYSFDPQVRQLFYARYQLFSAGNWFPTVSLTSSWQRSIEQRKKQKKGESIKTTENDDVRVFGLSLELHAQPFTCWTVSTGVDYYADEVQSWRKDMDVLNDMTIQKRGLYPDDAEARSFAVYIDNSMQIRKLKINIGGRFNSYKMSASDETFDKLKIHPTAWIGSASMMYSLHPDHNFMVSVSQGFRAPNINDMSSLGAFDYGIEVPSTDLSPENTMNFEFGFKSRMNQMTGSLAVYRTNLSNLIDRVQSTYEGSEYFENQRVYIKENVDQAYIQGVEAELEFQISNHTALFGNLIYTYGQKISSNEPMRRIPPLNAQVGVRLSFNQDAWGEARFLFAGKQDRLARGDIDDHRIPEGGTPAWMVFNLNGGYSFNSTFDFMFGLQNLFDEAYRLHGSGVDAYGRSLWIGINMRL